MKGPYSLLFGVDGCGAGSAVVGGCDGAIAGGESLESVVVFLYLITPARVVSDVMVLFVG